MADDLVKRLRKRQESESIDGYKRVEWEDEDALEAADHIEALERAILDYGEAAGYWLADHINDENSRNVVLKLFKREGIEND